MDKAIISDWLLPLTIVSATYLASFFLVFWLFLPLQEAVFGHFGSFAILVFLPHGVRVLTAWLFGLRAIILIAPASLASHAYLFGLSGFAWPTIGACIIGIICAPIIFYLYGKFFSEVSYTHVDAGSWLQIIGLGCLASIVNGFGSSLFYGTDIQSTFAYLLGDTLGLILSMVILMLSFRLLRYTQA